MVLLDVSGPEPYAQVRFNVHLPEGDPRVARIEELATGLGFRVTRSVTTRATALQREWGATQCLQALLRETEEMIKGNDR